MKAVITPGPLYGSLTMPPSKSVMQRVCAAVWARGGDMRIVNPGSSEDDIVLLQLLRAVGAAITENRDGSLRIVIEPAANHPLNEIYFGASGLAARMCIPIIALAGRTVRLMANESLSRRPMQSATDVLPKLGVSVDMQGGHFPAIISGKLIPRDVEVDGSVSSQFITGLLIAYSAAGAKDVRITVRGLVSRPYIRLTLDVMQSAGMKVPSWETGDVFHFDNASRPALFPASFIVEGDWSAAAFWLVAGAIAGPLTIRGLNVFSAQGDKAVLQVLMECGASLSIEAEQITVGPASLKAFHFDATDTPDLFPPLAALAVYCGGTSVIEGMSRLAGKESNRAATIVSELAKMGADIVVQDDLMIIRGGQTLHGATGAAHNDHRIAMMCAITALCAEGKTIIDGAEAVRKSYPRFFDDFQKAGGMVVLSG